MNAAAWRAFLSVLDGGVAVDSTADDLASDDDRAWFQARSKRRIRLRRRFPGEMADQAPRFRLVCVSRGLSSAAWHALEGRTTQRELVALDRSSDVRTRELNDMPGLNETQIDRLIELIERREDDAPFVSSSKGAS